MRKIVNSILWGPGSTCLCLLSTKPLLGSTNHDTLHGRFQIGTTELTTLFDQPTTKTDKLFSWPYQIQIDLSALQISRPRQKPMCRLLNVFYNDNRRTPQMVRY